MMKYTLIFFLVILIISCDNLASKKDVRVIANDSSLTVASNSFTPKELAISKKSNAMFLENQIGLIGQGIIKDSNLFISKDSNDIYLKNSYYPTVSDSAFYILNNEVFLYKIAEISTCAKMAAKYNIKSAPGFEEINFDCQLYNIGIKGEFISQKKIVCNLKHAKSQKNGSFIIFKLFGFESACYTNDNADILQIERELNLLYEYPITENRHIKKKYDFIKNQVSSDNENKRIKVNEIYKINGKYILSITTADEYPFTAFYLVKGRELIPLAVIPIP
jgi:hypothetical protein